MTQFSLPFESARSDRLVLRKAIGHDLNGYIELYSDPQVRRYLGGPIPAKRLRTRLEAHGIASITNDPGAFVIADSPTGDMMGMVTLERRAAHRPGHAADAANELELSYLLRRRWWRQGVAFQATVLLLQTASAHLPDQPVIVVTQAANSPSLALAKRLGFEHAVTFTEFDAEQWLGVGQLHKLGHPDEPLDSVHP